MSSSGLGLSDELLFEDDEPAAAPPSARWKLLVVDDEPGVHDVTRLALSGFEYDARRLDIVSAYSAREAKEMLRAHPDTALVLLDVVMERDDAGLEVIDYARTELKNELTRFVLRTGQPGHAPERDVVLRYDITDYKTKTELTSTKLFTAVVATLRTYDRLHALAEHRRHAEESARALARFVPHEFMTLLHKRDITEVHLGDQVQREMTIMFADIRGFTERSESMTPAECFAFVNGLFGEVCPKIREHGGFIDKYLGDGFMALFSGTADAAVAAAVTVQRALRRYNRQLRAQGRERVELGIGLHSGLLMLGAVGEEGRMEATVLSDAVNLASRVERLTKRFGVGLVISEQTLLALEEPNRYGYRFVDNVRVQGKTNKVAVYEVIDGGPGEESALKFETVHELERGQQRYAAGAFAEAAVHFDRVLQRNPSDTVARMYLRRAALAMIDGPERVASVEHADASGVWVPLSAD